VVAHWPLRELDSSIDILAQQIEVEKGVQPAVIVQPQFRCIAAMHFQHFIRSKVKRLQLAGATLCIHFQVAIREPNFVPHRNVR